MLYNKDTIRFFASIGEDGMVFVHCLNDIPIKKYFIRSTDLEATKDIRTLLATNPDAELHIYIDVLDQDYLVRNVPAVNKLTLDALARNKYKKEVPKNSISCYYQIGREYKGRKDWIYIFAYSNYEGNVSAWINFFKPFDIIIHGIYFLPIETYSLISKIRSFNQPHSFKDILKSYFQKSVAKVKGKDRWEIIIADHKSGGFRQVAFYNGRVVFTRLLNSIDDPNPEVIADGLSHEIMNSLEYLGRIPMRSDYTIDLYIIVPINLKTIIKPERFGIENIYIYTPFDLAEFFNISGQYIKGSDKFADPLYFAIFNKFKSFNRRLFTPDTKKIYIAKRIIYTAKALLLSTIPVVVILMLAMWYHIWDSSTKYAEVDSQNRTLESKINALKKEEATILKNLGEQITHEFIDELKEIDGFFADNSANPFAIVAKLSDLREGVAKIKNISWKYSEKSLSKFSKAQNKNTYTFQLNIQFLLRNFGKTYEQLIQNYDKFAKEIKSILKGYKIEISDLPQNFTFEDFGKPLAIDVKIDNSEQNQSLSLSSANSSNSYKENG